MFLAGRVGKRKGEKWGEGRDGEEGGGREIGVRRRWDAEVGGRRRRRRGNSEVGVG